MNYPISISSDTAGLSDLSTTTKVVIGIIAAGLILAQLSSNAQHSRRNARFKKHGWEFRKMK